MRTLVTEVATTHTAESLADCLRGDRGTVLVTTALPGATRPQFSFVTVRPFLVFESSGMCCEVEAAGRRLRHYGDPWRGLEQLLGRYELPDDLDLPFPLGGAFGYWGYGLRRFVEPKAGAVACDDLELPDCHLGFYGSLVAFDHTLGKTWIIATGLELDGSRCPRLARAQTDFWQRHLESAPDASVVGFEPAAIQPQTCASTFTRSGFVAAVKQAQRYIRAGDIYQVNLSQRLAAPTLWPAWELFRRLSTVSPAPCAAFLDCDRFQLASSSPELFLRISGAHVRTRPIKGTRPRSVDPTRDAQLAYELQTSPKELAELVMITDLLRNDLGRVCEFGSVAVPELARLEKFPHVQHLVSTVEGQLRQPLSHCRALAACFPGGSITGAPKIRAMEVIDELEPVARGPYTGCLGCLGFNRESLLTLIIRSAIVLPDATYFHIGAGIVADSVAEAEYDETLAKACGFFEALGVPFEAATEELARRPFPQPAGRDGASPSVTVAQLPCGAASTATRG